MASMLPADYGLVFGGLFGTILANTYLSVNVSIARKKYGIKYPTLYATKEHIDGKKCKDEKDILAYNCAQRAHQNTAENQATVQLLGALNGLLFPRFSAGCLGLWALGRVLYGYGYTSGGPSGRMAGGLISHLGDIPLWFCTAYSGLTLLGYVGTA